MDLFDILKIIGIVLNFIVLVIIFATTFRTSIFSFTQFTVAYLLLIYSMIVEIFSQIFKKK